VATSTPAARAARFGHGTVCPQGFEPKTMVQPSRGAGRGRGRGRPKKKATRKGTDNEKPTTSSATSSVTSSATSSSTSKTVGKSKTGKAHKMQTRGVKVRKFTVPSEDSDSDFRL